MRHENVITRPFASKNDASFISDKNFIFERIKGEVMLAPEKAFDEKAVNSKSRL